MATFRTSQPGSAADPSVPHLILVGLPGAGKSTVGSALARELGRTFLDFDTEIARREGMTIAEIFATRGEPTFRQLEHGLTEELKDTGGMVLAPGGGWVKDPVNMALLRPPSRIIMLAASPETALARMGADRESRPLMDRPDPLATIRELAESRRQAYESADAVVDTEVLDLQGVIARVVELARGDRGE